MNILELPADIMETIFIDSVHSCSSQRTSVDTDSSTNPVDLTHVCQLWRAIAISTPQLWATIRVNCANSNGHVRMFELWLQRSAGSSGNYPLTLTINQKRRGFVPRCLGPLISLAIAEHRRWKEINLSLYGDSQAFFSPLFKVTSLPILRGFKVNIVDWDSEATRHLTRILCSSPVLESVHFGSPSILPAQINLSNKFVPWHRLKTASFHVLSPSHFVQIVSFSTSLHKISVSSLSGTEAGTSIPHVTSGSLQFIKIGGLHCSNVFDKLTIPALQQLHLPCGLPEFDDRIAGSESLFRCLERSECKLQVLTIESPTITFLKSPLFKDLVVLEVTWGFNMDELLEALGEACPETRCPRLLPLLEVLTLRQVKSVDRVRDVVSARIAAYGGRDRSKLRRVSANKRHNGSFVLDMDLTAVEALVALEGS